MTEEEAKTKICCGPPILAALYAAAKMERESDPHCIGSKCMAWRWTITPATAEKISTEAFPTTENGHCGLAGAPYA